MQLRERVKKLEEKFNVNGPTNCNCFQASFEAQINKAYGDPYNENDILPIDFPLEGNCQRCNKPIGKEVKEMCGILVTSYGETENNN